MITAKQLILTDLALEILGVNQTLQDLQQNRQIWTVSGVRTINGQKPDDKGNIDVSIGSAAPVDAQYLTLATNSTLTSERVFTPSSNFTPSDGGAGGAYSLDLSDTGVSANSYGSSTQVAAFTVDAKGRLTAASNIAISLTGIGGASSSEPFVTIGNTSGLSAERALTGTTNQITVTDNGANSTVVLSLPQNIHTAATPTFAGLTLSGLAAGRVIFTGTGGILSVDSGLLYTAAGPLTLTRTAATTSADVYGYVAAITNTPVGSAYTGRLIGASYSVTSGGSQNFTNGNGGLTGLELAAHHGGTGTVSLFMSVSVPSFIDSTGIIATGYGVDALGVDVSSGGAVSTEWTTVNARGPRASGGGTVAEANNFAAVARVVSGSNRIVIQRLFYGSSINNFDGNNQTRIGIQLNAMPTNGGSFTGSAAAAIWINSDSGGTQDAIALGLSRDTLVYRSGAAALAVTGSITSSSFITAATTVTAPTSVLTPLLTTASAVALLIRGFDGATTAAVTLRGGVPTNSGAAGGDMIIYVGAGGPMGGAAAATFIRRTNGTTNVIQVNDTGIGLNAATPVAQSTGWAVSNVTSDKVLDANSTTIDELADVSGTMITYLLSRGDFGA